MLQQARKAVPRLVASRVPPLPFAANCFAATIAGFLLSHISDYRSFLADVFRVLRRRGRCAFTAWGNNENEFRNAWEQIAYECISEDEMKRETRPLIPWEELFYDPSSLIEACRGSGFADVNVERRIYNVEMSREEFLRYRSASMQGRLLNERLDEEWWYKFMERAERTFASLFPEILRFQQCAFLCVGMKP